MMSNDIQTPCHILNDYCFLMRIFILAECIAGEALSGLNKLQYSSLCSCLLVLYVYVCEYFFSRKAEGFLLPGRVVKRWLNAGDIYCSQAFF